LCQDDLEANLDLKNRPKTRAAVRDAIVARAPANAVAGGSAALAGLVDGLFDDWIGISDEQSAGGNVFGYANRQSPHRLLHMPLAPEIPNLSAPHQRFVAGRSMRDVESSVACIIGYGSSPSRCGPSRSRNI
jgi:hypothetical protein